MKTEKENLTCVEQAWDDTFPSWWKARWWLGSWDDASPGAVWWWLYTTEWTNPCTLYNIPDGVRALARICRAWGVLEIHQRFCWLWFLVFVHMLLWPVCHFERRTLGVFYLYSLEYLVNNSFSDSAFCLKSMVWQRRWPDQHSRKRRLLTCR